jgi:XTP/dITP diphosphohydrolase
VIAFVRSADDVSPLIGTGSWPGRILRAPRGEGGFGYDPIFVPTDLDATASLSAAELLAAEKNARSHRARALQALREHWR